MQETLFKTRNGTKGDSQCGIPLSVRVNTHNYWEIITVESVILTNLSAIWAYGSRPFCHFTPSLWYLWVDLPDIHLSKHFLTFRLKAAINIETKLLILTTFFRVKNRIIVQRRAIEHVSVFASTLKKSIGAQVLFPKRERLFHRGIQTPRNTWKKNEK